MRKGRKIVFVLGLVRRVSVAIIVAKYKIFPTLTMAARAKKISVKAICSRHAHAIARHQRALSRFGARLRILNLIAWLC